MAITRGIKDKLNKYGLNLPVDRRTRAYANILKKNKWTILTQLSSRLYFSRIISEKKKMFHPVS